MIRVAVAAWLILCGSMAIAGVPEPEGFRQDNYRAPVPDTVAGGHVIHTADLKRLIDGGGIILVDVLGVPRKPAGMRPGQPWMPLPRRDIPGSLWLPDLGQGMLDGRRDTWFRDELAAATAGDADKRIVFYCLSGCWLSWNATKRVLGYGYRNATWYPDGTDGWQAAGFALAQAQPEVADEQSGADTNGVDKRVGK